jgi:antirestriction protein ArdC
MHKDVYFSITERVIADLEQGVRPWQRPWRNPNGHTFVPLPLRATGEAYRGVNILLLWLQALDKGFVAPHWLTFKQAQALGAQVRKGERASQVVYAGTLNRTETDDTGAEIERGIPFLKAYAVFNAEQIDGLPDRFIAQLPTPITDTTRNARAEAFVTATAADIRHGGTQAYYSPSHDHIQMPPFVSFITADGYYATLAHELVHWTGHASRLDRDLSRTRWGDAAYAAEELVAELGAAFVCAELQLTPQVREDHAAYIACWLKVLKTDKRAIFTAAAQAQRAADFLLPSIRATDPATEGQPS